MSVNKSQANTSIKDKDTGLSAKVELDGDGKEALRVIADIGGSVSLDSAVTVIDPQHGGAVRMTPAGDMRTAELIRLAGANFGDGPIQTHLYVTSTTGSGTVVQAGGDVTLTTGATANSTAFMQTASRARFITATYNATHTPMVHADFFAADNKSQWGAFDPVNPIGSGDGLYMENNAGTVTLCRLKGGTVVQTIAEGAFNGGNTFTKDNNLHLYEIIYNAGSAQFYQDGKLLHKVAFGEVGYEHLHLTGGVDIENINGNTVSNSITLYALAISRYGSNSAVDRAYRVAASGSGIINDVPSTLARVVITSLGTGSASITLYDATDSASNIILTLDLTQSVRNLEVNIETNNALSYSSTGANFEVLVVYN